MNINERIYEELLEASENVDNAEAMVLLIEYSGDKVSTNCIGSCGSILSMLCLAFKNVLKRQPAELERELRMKTAQMILGGMDDATE